MKHGSQGRGSGYTLVISDDLAGGAPSSWFYSPYHYTDPDTLSPSSPCGEISHNTVGSCTRLVGLQGSYLIYLRPLTPTSWPSWDTFSYIDRLHPTCPQLSALKCFDTRRPAFSASSTTLSIFHLARHAAQLRVITWIPWSLTASKHQHIDTARRVGEEGLARS